MSGNTTWEVGSGRKSERRLPCVIFKLWDLRNSFEIEFFFCILLKDHRWFADHSLRNTALGESCWRRKNALGSFCYVDGEGWSQRKVADEFNGLHTDRSMRQSTVSRLLQKFKRTGSVNDLPRSGHPSFSPEVLEAVIAKFIASPKMSLWWISTELNVPKSTVYVCTFGF